MKDSKERTVIHVRFKNGDNFYFGSVAAIFTLFSPSDIGITYGSLRNKGLSRDKPYSNELVTIYKGVLRTIPKTNENEKKL